MLVLLLTNGMKAGKNFGVMLLIVYGEFVHCRCGVRSAEGPVAVLAAISCHVLVSSLCRILDEAYGGLILTLWRHHPERSWLLFDHPDYRNRLWRLHAQDRLVMRFVGTKKRKIMKDRQTAMLRARGGGGR